MKILCIGHSSFDISAPISEYPKENFKYRINNCLFAGGGPAANAAYLLGKWGMNTYYAGVVGNDSYGVDIKNEFQNVNVDTTFLEIDNNSRTSTSFIIINEENGSRTIFNAANSRPNLKNFEFDMNPDVLLVDGHEIEASKYALNKYPNSASIIDAGRATEEVIELCKMIKYLVCSKEFGEEVSGVNIDYNNPETLKNVYLGLKSKFPNAEVVVTLEARGALYGIGNSIKVMPAIKKDKIIDTTGAGDIFHGAFTYGVACGYDLEKIIKISNVTAGKSVTKLGGRPSIPNLDEVLEYYEKLN